MHIGLKQILNRINSIQSASEIFAELGIQWHRSGLLVDARTECTDSVLNAKLIPLFQLGPNLVAVNNAVPSWCCDLLLNPKANKCSVDVKKMLSTRSSVHSMPSRKADVSQIALRANAIASMLCVGDQTVTNRMISHPGFLQIVARMIPSELLIVYSQFVAMVETLNKPQNASESSDPNDALETESNNILNYYELLSNLTHRFYSVRHMLSGYEVVHALVLSSRLCHYFVIPDALIRTLMRRFIKVLDECTSAEFRDATEAFYLLFMGSAGSDRYLRVHRDLLYTVLGDSMDAFTQQLQDGKNEFLNSSSSSNEDALIFFQCLENFQHNGLNRNSFQRLKQRCAS